MTIGKVIEEERIDHQLSSSNCADLVPGQGNELRKKIPLTQLRAQAPS
jgi:hypothetical protein